MKPGDAAGVGTRIAGEEPGDGDEPSRLLADLPPAALGIQGGWFFLAVRTANSDPPPRGAKSCATCSCLRAPGRLRMGLTHWRSRTFVGSMTGAFSYGQRRSNRASTFRLYHNRATHRDRAHRRDHGDRVPQDPAIARPAPRESYTLPRHDALRI